MIVFEDVTKTYDPDVVGLQDFTCHIGKGEFVFLVGASGSGKSTASAAAVPESADARLSSRMMRYWTRFATTGDPNAEGQPRWSRYDPPRDRLMLLDDPAAESQAPYVYACEVSERASQLH